MKRKETAFIKATLTVIPISIEGLLTDKDTLSEAFCEDTERDVLSILEILAIYYGFDKKPKIDGIRLVVVRPHEE